MKKHTMFVPVTMQNGTSARIDIRSLPKKDWKTHSGHAPVANEEVNSLQSQQIAGTKSLLIKADSGAVLSVTQGEAEIFAFEYLKDLGYKVIAPEAARA